MEGINPTIGTLALLVMLGFIIGGVLTFRKGDKLKGTLMVVFALVVLGNLMIMSIPVPPQNTSAPAK